MGGEVDEDPGDDRRMAKGTIAMVVLGAYLLERGHHATDARRGTSLSGSGQELEGRDEEHLPRS